MIAPRKAARTVHFVDDYCAVYEDIFPEVRSFESFKYLHVGMISKIKRKSLPEIAKVVGIDNEQSLHHFLTDSPWDIKLLVQRRLSLILSMLKGESFILIIDETGDKKKGHSTDYVSRQYIGNLGKVENGLVSVNAYGVLGTIVFPLTFKIFKPKTTLKEEDTYKTKPELAGEIIQELRELGFKFEVVLADCLYGESKTFRKVLDECELKYVLAVRSNHQAWSEVSNIENSVWHTFDRIFANGKEQIYYIQEIICPGEEELRYWKITKDILKERKNTTWYLMTNLPGEIKQIVGNTYGFRNWIEYGLKQAKNELGWADFRLTSYAQIQRWWEIICCVYLMVSWHAIERNLANKAQTENENVPPLSQKEPEVYSRHEWWSFTLGWKSTLNNLHLIIQPYVFFNLLKPWLDIFNIPLLKSGFLSLQNIMNQFQGYMTFNSG
jgi:SRSO17 transposase